MRMLKTYNLQVLKSVIIHFTRNVSSTGSAKVTTSVHCVAGKKIIYIFIQLTFLDALTVTNATFQTKIGRNIVSE